MVRFDKEDLMWLLRQRGFDVVDMPKPIWTIKGKEMRAHPRRCYELGRLMPELDAFWHPPYNVRTIGVYNVVPITNDFMDPNYDSPRISRMVGVTIRWAYYAGI